MLRSRRKAELRRKVREENKADDLHESLVTILDPDSAASEAYRTLRTNLLYALAYHPPKVIVLTSPGRGEGKSATCANLGVLLSQVGKNVLIVDCDWRNPPQHKIFGSRDTAGIADVVAGKLNLQEVWQEPLPGLKVIVAGAVTTNPAELVSSERFAEFISQVRQQFDYVLVDCPPVGLTPDPLILAAQADGVLLVFDAQNTRKRAFRQSLRRLEIVGANVLATVMNNVDASDYPFFRQG